jgi:transposase
MPSKMARDCCCVDVIKITYRYVERTISWLHNYRRLAVRYERNPDMHMAFMLLAAALIGWKKLQP